MSILSICMIDQRFPTYHEKLCDDGFKPKWYIPLEQLPTFSYQGLAKLVLIPGDLVSEILPAMHRSKPEKVYVGYIKSR